MATDKKRTFAHHIYTPSKGAHRLELEYEIERTYENADVHRVAQSRVLRDLAALSAKPLPNGESKVSTYGDIHAIIAQCADQLAAEDEQQKAADAAALTSRRANELAAAKLGKVAMRLSDRITPLP